MPGTARDLVRQAVNVLAVLAVIAVNALANALPLYGRTTGEISDGFPILFVPAGYVFGIWGLIYLGLVGFALYQARPRERANLRLRRVGYLFALSCAANIAWLFAWHALRLPLSLAVMLALLALLILIYLRLGSGREEVPRAERLLVRLPFSLYLGWITVATVANASALLYSLGWDGWGLSDATWTILMLAAATAIGTLVLVTRRDLAFNLVLVWAFVGIFVAQQGHPPVAGAALAAARVVLVLVLLSAFRTPDAPGGALQGG
ncbi:hypothetical protein BH24DEI1_BH24DEI1_16030 [soil metagenome]